MKLNRLKYEMVLVHPSCFVTKKAYEKYGLFDTNLKYAMDKDLMARFYRSGAKFAYIPETIVIMYAGGASDTNVSKVFQEGCEIAVRNGVPKWKAVLRRNVYFIRWKIVEKIKHCSMIWKLLKREEGKC